MAIEQLAFGGNGNDRPQRRLSLFVTQLGVLLHAAIFEEGERLFYDGMLPKMRTAWEPVLVRITDYSIQVSDAPLDTLHKHGLTDEELDFKFAAVNFVATRFYQSLSGPLRIVRTWFSKLLEILDKLFRSLLAAVPGGGAIEEYKDICESLIPIEG